MAHCSAFYWLCSVTALRHNPSAIPMQCKQRASHYYTNLHEKPDSIHFTTSQFITYDWKVKKLKWGISLFLKGSGSQRCATGLYLISYDMTGHNLAFLVSTCTGMLTSFFFSVRTKLEMGVYSPETWQLERLREERVIRWEWLDSDVHDKGQHFY